MTALSLNSFFHFVSLLVVHFRHSFWCIDIIFRDIVIHLIHLLIFNLFSTLLLLVSFCKLLLRLFYLSAFSAIFCLLLLSVHLAEFCEKLRLLVILVIVLPLWF